VRGTVDASVRPADTEKAGCYGSLVYASMAKMEATDAGVAGMDAPGDTGAAGMEPRGRSKCQTVTDAVDRAGWDAGAGATSAFRR
jgi:hypothetical protein